LKWTFKKMSIISTRKTTQRLEFKTSLVSCAASAGGGVFIACDHLPVSCRNQMRKAIGLPVGSGSSTFAQFDSNTASKYGNDVATESSTLSFVGQQQFHYIPGQESLNFTVGMLDSMDELVVGSDDIVRVSICALSNPLCEDITSLVLVGFYPFAPESGLSRIMDKQTVLCSLSASGVVARLSLVAAPKVLPLTARIECLPCQQGQSRAENQHHGTWSCKKCQHGEYVLDPNNPAFGCQQCPQGAICSGGELQGRVPGSLWVPDFATGQYLLTKCPEVRANLIEVYTNVQSLIFRLALHGAGLPANGIDQRRVGSYRPAMFPVRSE
jgi:hypothetical protein